MADAQIDVHGPVFISYRHSDGWAAATMVARTLRAAGVPIWRDKHDLPPGDTEERLREALAAGISGAVLIVTNDIAMSEIVKTIEAPQLVSFAENDRQFQLQLINNVKVDGRTDYHAPNRLLELDGVNLRRFDQQPATRRGAIHIAQAMAEGRVQNHRAPDRGSPLSISIQSRNESRASDITPSTLDIRLKAGRGARLPARESLHDLLWLSEHLPTMLTVSGSGSLEISGGAHLSHAFAIGATLPSTRAANISVRQGTDGLPWEASAHRPREAVALSVEPFHGTSVSGDPIAVYIDAVSNPPSDQAFLDFWGEHADGFHSGSILRQAVRAPISPEHGADLAAELMHHIRTLWNDAGNGIVHLFLRVPFPLAILLGWSSNTLIVHTYEWDATPPARFVPAVEVHSGATPRPVRAVLKTYKPRSAAVMGPE